MSATAQEVLEQLRQQSPAQRRLNELRIEAPAAERNPVLDSMPEMWDETSDPIPTSIESSVPSLTRGITVDQFNEGAGIVADVAKDIGGAADFAKTILTGAAGEITGGFGTTLGVALGIIDPEDAKKSVEATSNLMTLMPWTERGSDLLEAVAVPLMKLEEGGDDLSFALAKGNPEVATLIKTALFGGAELLIPGPKGVKTFLNSRKLAKEVKAMRAKADQLGVSLKMDEYASSVVDLAARMTPDQRAQHMPYLIEKLDEAAVAAKGRKDAAYEIAKRSETWVETRAVRALADDLEATLFEKGYDLNGPDMKVVRDTLDDMRISDLGPEGSFSGESIAVRLGQLELVRKRAGQRWRANKDSPNKALTEIKHGIDRFIDNEFNKIAQEQGSAISGETAGVQAWKDARELNTIYRQNFKEDKVIRSLVEKDSTPEQYSAWLMGASAMGARKEAASTVARIKKILGDDHPALEGIRQDILFSVAEPLLRDIPAWTTFLNNYNKVIKNNPSLVRELGLDAGDLKQLHDFALIQTRLPHGTPVTIADLTQAASRFFVGHKIARATVRVNFFRGVLNKMVGLNRVSQKQILADLVGVKNNQPVVPRNSPVWAQFMADTAMLEFSAGASLTSLPDTQEDNE